MATFNTNLKKLLGLIINVDCTSSLVMVLINLNLMINQWIRWKTILSENNQPIFLLIFKIIFCCIVCIIYTKYSCIQRLLYPFWEQSPYEFYNAKFNEKMHLNFE